MNRKRSDLIMVSLIRLKGYWTGGEIKLILFVFTFLYRWDGGGVWWRNKSNFVCFQFLLAAHSPLSPSKPKFS